MMLCEDIDRLTKRESCWCPLIVGVRSATAARTKVGPAWLCVVAKCVACLIISCACRFQRCSLRNARLQATLRLPSCFGCICSYLSLFISISYKSEKVNHHLVVLFQYTSSAPIPRPISLSTRSLNCLGRVPQWHQQFFDCSTAL